MISKFSSPLEVNPKFHLSNNDLLKNLSVIISLILKRILKP